MLNVPNKNKKGKTFMFFLGFLLGFITAAGAFAGLIYWVKR